MDAYDTILSILDANGGKVSGRTAIQKLVYLVGCLDPSLKVADYRPYYYGPFSRNVATSLGYLVVDGLVYETRNPGLDNGGYTYHLTREADATVETIAKDNGKACDIIKDTVTKSAAACGLNVSSLSFAAKVHYICTEEGGTFETATKHAESLGWDMNEEEAAAGRKVLERLDLGIATQGRP